MRTPMFEHQCDVAFSNWKLVAYLSSHISCTTARTRERKCLPKFAEGS